MKKIKMILCVRCGNKVHPAMELCPFCDHRLQYPDTPEVKPEPNNPVQIFEEAFESDPLGTIKKERLPITLPRRHAKLIGGTEE